jgi:hypothetical protein
MLAISSICITAVSSGIDKEGTNDARETIPALNLNNDPFDLEIKSRLFSVRYTITPTSSCDGHGVYTGKWNLKIGADEVADKTIPLNCNPENAFTGNTGAFGFGVDTVEAELKIYDNMQATGEPIQSLEKEGTWFFGIFLLRK